MASCLLAPVDTLIGSAYVLCTVVAWIMLCGTPWRILRPALGAALAMFLPLFLLTPWVGADPDTTPLSSQLLIPWRMVARGLSTMLISIATMTSLQAWEWHAGLSRLPLPRMLIAILVQIAHQTAMLIDETSRLASAIAVRSARSRGRAAIQLLFALPRVWLPRVIERADRTGAAMEVRGLHGQLPRDPHHRLALADGLWLLASCLWLLAALTLRWGGWS